MSFGSSKQKTAQQTKTDPWAPAVPYLKTYLSKVGAAGTTTGVTPGQSDAFGQLMSNASAGNPFADDISKAASGALTYDNADQSKVLGDAYSQLQTNLGDYASGKYLDVTNNPELQAALKVAADDAQSRINQMFAGAGRSMSGANQGAVARGVTSATAPLLLGQLNQQQQNQISAANTLFNAGQSTASGQSALDTTKANIQAGGVPISQSAIDAQNYGANQILNLEQQEKELPFQDLALLSSLLLPAAGLGGTSNSTGTTKGTQFGITSQGVGSGISALGSLLALSDENAKEDIEKVGELEDGQDVYRYRYKDDPSGEVHIGLLAQQVAKENPEAVGDLPGGMMGVDYDAATKQAAKMVRAAMAKRGTKHAA